jgi:uncharacterized protein
MVTTWPCLVEAMYLLGRAGGLAAQDELWGLLADGLVELNQPGAEILERLRALMHQYHDIPMDLADASLVVAAEDLATNRIITLDRHFHAYRIRGQHPFDILP